MSSKETGGPAFPVADYDHQVFQPENVEEVRRDLSGMTLRDYFAAKADLDLDEYTVLYATGILGYGMPDYAAFPVENAAFWAAFRAKMRFIEADAMLAERAK
ncbi:hypothetical protein D3C76_554080 [compost metagenome]